MLFLFMNIQVGFFINSYFSECLNEVYEILTFQKISTYNSYSGALKKQKIAVTIYN